MTTRKTIIDALVKHNNIDRSVATRAVEGVIDALANSFRNGQSVQIRGFATFRVKRVAEKVGRNIAAGTPVIIPPHTTVKIILSNELKNSLKHEKPKSATAPPTPSACWADSSHDEP